MGIEALSRGAESCVFVDKSPHAAKIVRENLVGASKFSDVFKSKTSVIQMDAFSFLQSASQNEKFDLVFLDPPFNNSVFSDILKSLESVLSFGGLVVFEREFSGKDTFLEQVGALKLRKEYKYGRVSVAVYVFEET